MAEITKRGVRGVAEGLPCEHMFHGVSDPKHILEIVRKGVSDAVARS